MSTVSASFVERRLEMDTFTLDHLADWCQENAWDDEALKFESWAIEQVNNDPTLADYGWPSLYRSFHLEMAR